jgi:serine/threonine protein kinase
MAPEVVTGKKVAQIGKCDVFSLGILSFILIFGFEPFSTNYSGYWFTLIKLNKWTDFWRDRTVSDEFKEFFEKMINFNNEDRYSLDEAFEN